MTTAGSRRHDAKGRSTGRLKAHPKSKLEGPFIAHTRDLLASPVWGVLTLADRRVLDRLELEHMAHAGTENGNLKCTYTDFENHGIRRASIAPALRRLETLGLVETIERGRIARGEFRFPAIYRLTYVGGNIPATDDWKRHATPESVERALSKVIHKNKKPDAKTLPLPGAKSLPLNSIPGRENATPVPGTKTLPPSISWGDTTARTASAPPCPAKSKGRGKVAHRTGTDTWVQAGNALENTGLFEAKAANGKG